MLQKRGEATVFVFLLIGDDGSEIIGLLFTKHYKRMLYVATQMLGHHRGEEAVQDVFSKLLEKFTNNFQELSKKPAQYFVIIIRNHAINLSKAEKIMTNTDDFNESIFIDNEAASNPEAVVIENEAEDILVEHIRRMKPSYRSLLEMKYIEELTNNEIARILNVTPAAVTTKIERARNTLKQILEEEGAFVNE